MMTPHLGPLTVELHTTSVSVPHQPMHAQKVAANAIHSLRSVLQLIGLLGEESSSAFALPAGYSAQCFSSQGCTPYCLAASSLSLSLNMFYAYIPSP